MTYTAGPEVLSSIARLVTEARPTWDAHLVQVVLQSHAHQVDGNDLAIAALRAAANPNLPGPKAIGWRGPHWRDLGTVPPEAQTWKWCGVCGRKEPDCYSVRLADDDHVFEPTERAR